jgi:hypothetical protein
MEIFRKAASSPFEESMRILSIMLLVFLCCACYSEAQTQKVLLLGSTQDITKLPFCKTYKCRQAAPGNFLRNGINGTVTKVYYLYVPSNVYLSDTDDPPDFMITTDKKRQVTSLEFRFTSQPVNNRSILSDQNILLVDVIRITVGKILPLDMSLGEKYSEDILNCLDEAKAKTKGNKEHTMLTGKIMLQVDKLKAKYRVRCFAPFNSTKTNQLYNPTFIIETYK